MKKPPLLQLSMLTLAVVLLAFLFRFSIPILERIELDSLDLRFKFRGLELPSEEEIVLVTIDDFSFEVLPERWPWPREYYARAIGNLQAAGARAIGIDVIFDVEDRRGAESDLALANAIKAAETVVLSGKIEQSARLKSYQYLVEPTELLKAAAGNRWGVVSIPIDADVIHRRYQLLHHHQDLIHPSFAIEILRLLNGYGIDVATLNDGERVTFGDYHIPLYDGVSMFINYRGPGQSFPHYSFASVIDDPSLNLGEDDLNYFTEHLLPDSVFKDKVVLIGSTVEELHDNFATPFLTFNQTHRSMPGVELHANALDTIIRDRFFSTVPYTIIFLLTLVMAFLVQVFSQRTNLAIAITATGGLLAATIATGFWLFTSQRVIIELTFPVMGILMTFIAANFYQYIITQREKRLILGAFQHYVPAKVVQDLMEHPDKLKLGGEERVMTVLFSDVANFTTISESLTPTQLVTLINNYLSEMTGIVLEYDGIIDKYEGDAIMAEFGAPVYFADHALKSCYAALDMHARLKTLARQARREGKPVLSSRIGINTGNMVVGNMGSHQVFDYTVMGDEVNLASRLEGANKVFGTSIMISESTQVIVSPHFHTRPLDALRVKGKNKPVQVFELIDRKEVDLPEELAKLLPLYQKGVRLYHERRWADAAETFRQCLRLKPDDGPSKVYLKRVVEFGENPPPVDWDGVYHMTSK